MMSKIEFLSPWIYRIAGERLYLMKGIIILIWDKEIKERIKSWDKERTEC